MAGWAVSEVSPTAFACKWGNGRARPEEVAWAVSQAGHPARSASLDPRQDHKYDPGVGHLTAYPEGSPRHPSSPAMHSAASSAALWVAVMMDLSRAQLADARRLDWAVSRFRTLAGVHYDSDNRVGLSIGQEVIARRLPDFLAQFGADRDAVRRKIEQVRTDWSTYTGFE